MREKMFKQFGYVAIAAIALSLGGCQTLNTQAGVSNAVTKVQAVYSDLKTDASVWLLTHPSDAAVVAKAETALDPEIAALSGATPPTTVVSVLGDLNNQVQALPSSLVSTTTKNDLQAAFDAANLLEAVSG
jgi:hypothetical protein